MGALPSKEPHCDLEYFAPIHGRYTQIAEEPTSSCNTAATQHVIADSKSSGTGTPFCKRTIMDASESNTKNSSRKIHQPPRGHRHLTLRMIIRRRPSYRKALREHNCLPMFTQKTTIEEYIKVQNEKVVDNRIKHTAKEQENICENVNTALQATEESLKKSADNGEREIDVEKLMRDLRTAYELKKNINGNGIEIFCMKEKSTFKISNRQSQRRTPYEKVKPNSAADLNNQTKPPQQEEQKSVLLMEIENKLNNLRKTGCKEVLDIERLRNIKPYFVSCLAPAEAIMKEKLLAELMLYFTKNDKK